MFAIVFIAVLISVGLWLRHQRQVAKEILELKILERNLRKTGCKRGVWNLGEL